MIPVFCDTVYFLALLNPTDRLHTRARDFSRQKTQPLLTTEWVLLEVGDALCRGANRQRFGQLLEALARAPQTAEIIPASSALFQRGCRLFWERGDKDWSLTDCLSFIVMRERGIQDALTHDHHFEQAGFRALLKG